MVIPKPPSEDHPRRRDHDRQNNQITHTPLPGETDYGDDDDIRPDGEDSDDHEN
jgi:hypothetical protein